MAQCQCKPGTYANGWQEKRCETCVKAERDAFYQVLINFTNRNYSFGKGIK